MNKKVAIVGSGISGLTAAYKLTKLGYDITLFENNDRLGGHTATIDIEHNGEKLAVDTGFIVYNDWTYPNFIQLLNELNVETQETSMSFSVSCETSGIEYAGNNLNTLFSDRKNLVSPRFWKMVSDILKFNKQSIEDLENNRISEDITLGQYLSEKGYGDLFISKYLVPMGAAIWSSGTEAMLDFPLLFFVRFFRNHGLLSVSHRPRWRVIQGGSKQYIAPLTQLFKQQIKLNTEITNIVRNSDGVTIDYTDKNSLELRCESEEFDYLVIATHSDQALKLLNDASSKEVELLGAIPYAENEVVLHTDENLLPGKKLAWSSWNYNLRGIDSEKSEAKLTYNMNILQSLPSKTTYCVSLNQTDAIDPSKILRTFNYSHPVFTLEGMKAQQRWQEIAGYKNTWYCGAYWANGFHEDGVVSALRVVDSIEKESLKAIDSRLKSNVYTFDINKKPQTKAS